MFSGRTYIRGTIFFNISIESEALAIVKCGKHFRTYLEGNTFTILSDHNPVTHLSDLKDSHGQVGVISPELPVKDRPQEWHCKHEAGGLSRELSSASKVGGVSKPPVEVNLATPVTPTLSHAQREMAATSLEIDKIILSSECSK